MATISFLLPSCQKAEAPEGQLPVYQVGDSWVWSYVMDGTTYTLTEKVTGSETVEGRDCYAIDMSFEPAITSTHDGVVYTVTMKYFADKISGLLGVKMEMTISSDEQTFTSSEIYSYDPWIELFPLEIGKVVEAGLTTTQKSGGIQVGDAVVTTEKYVVDGKEEVTVTAGTFNCWKIIIYDGAGNVTLIMWYSDTVKSGIKTVDAQGKVMMELKSYSVS